MRSIKQLLEEAGLYDQVSIVNDINNSNQEQHDDEQHDAEPIPGGIDIALAGELKYYSEANHIFKDRKIAISDYYKNEVKYDMVWSAEYISKTIIFKKYVDDLIKFYQEDIDPECKLNISTYDELCRQLADDIILLSKNTQIR